MYFYSLRCVGVHRKKATLALSVAVLLLVYPVNYVEKQNANFLKMHDVIWQSQDSLSQFQLIHMQILLFVIDNCKVSIFFL